MNDMTPRANATDPAEPQWLDEDEMRLWRSFVEVSVRLLSTLDARLKAAAGVSFDDYEVLVHLSEAPDRRLRMAELSDRLIHSRSRLTQRVDRLARRGLVRREKCAGDRRGTWAVLTAEGLAALRESRAALLGMWRGLEPVLKEEKA